MSDPYVGLLKWLQQGTRTFGWGCLIAWDRNRLNRLLLQNYVDNVNSDSYLPPFEDVVLTSDVTAELIYDYTLDYPRLSFENASLTDSRARLRMKVVRGSQLSVEQHQDGSPRLAKVSEVNVLNGPTLTMNLALNRMPGTVGSAGKLILNIAKGSSFDMGFADTPEERSLGGEYFREKFELLDDDQKIFVLGEVSVPDEHFLKPADFRVRIHRNPNDPTEGAVLLMVRMEGDNNGHEPPANDGMRYLLVAEHSFAMLLSHDVMISKALTHACREMTIGSTGIAFEPRVESPEEGATHYLHAAAGVLAKFSMLVETTNFKPASMPDIRLPLASASAGFKLTFKGSDILLEWSGEHTSGLVLNVHGIKEYRTAAKISFTFERAYRLELNRSEGLVSLVQVPQGEVSTLTIRINDSSIPSSIVSLFNTEAAQELEQMQLQQAQYALQRFEGGLGDIAVGPMTSRLFGGSEHLDLEYVDFCRDMAIFGKVSPWQTTFFVEPMEVVLGPGKSCWFTTSSLRDVIWSVENLPGESGPVGMMSPLGFYIAPYNVPGRFLRVKVSATARSDGFTSSALVTVINSLISIRPQVMVHSAGSDRGREMRAGSYRPGELTWEVHDPSSGARIVPSAAEDGDHTYFPGPAIPGTSFSIDEIKVSNRFGSQSAYVLVTHFTMGLVVKAQPIGNGETVQLKGYNGGADIPDSFTREWKVLLGGGTVDATSGVFTPGAASAWLFSIVTLKVWVTETVTSEGYILLPLPYIDISEIDWKPPALSPNN